MREHGRPVVALTVLIILVLAIVLAAGCGGKETTSTAQENGGSTATTTHTGPTNKVLVVVADQDFNEVECGAVIDAFEGGSYEMVLANVSGSPSVGDSMSSLPVDTSIDKVKASDYAAVVIVGGMGATQYFEDPQLRAVIQEMDAAGKVVSAICIAPVILANAGVLQSKEATVSQGMEDELSAKGAVVVAQPVVVDGLIVTGWGPDAANEFAQAVKVALTP